MADTANITVGLGEQHEVEEEKKQNKKYIFINLHNLAVIIIKINDPVLQPT